MNKDQRENIINAITVVTAVQITRVIDISSINIGIIELMWLREVINFLISSIVLFVIAGTLIVLYKYLFIR